MLKLFLQLWIEQETLIKGVNCKMRELSIEHLLNGAPSVVDLAGKIICCKAFETPHR